MMAAVHAARECILRLLELGADPNIRSRQKCDGIYHTALSLAIKQYYDQPSIDMLCEVTNAGAVCKLVKQDSVLFSGMDVAVMDLAGTRHVKPTKKISNFLERYFSHDDMEIVLLKLSNFLAIAASNDNTWFLVSFLNIMNAFGENFAGSLKNECMKKAIEGDCVEAVRIIHMEGRQTGNHSAENIALAHMRGNTKIIQILEFGSFHFSNGQR